MVRDGVFDLILCDIYLIHTVKGFWNCDVIYNIMVHNLLVLVQVVLICKNMMGTFVTDDKGLLLIASETESLK